MGLIEKAYRVGACIHSSVKYLGPYAAIAKKKDDLNIEL